MVLWEVDCEYLFYSGEHSVCYISESIKAVVTHSRNAMCGEHSLAD